MEVTAECSVSVFFHKGDLSLRHPGDNYLFLNMYALVWGLIHPALKH